MGDIAVMTRIHQIARTRTARKVARITLVVVAMGLVVRFMSSSLPEIKDSMARLKDGDVRFLLAAVGVQVLWTFSRSQIFRSGLRGFGGNLTRRSAVRISMASFSMSRIVPGGGAAGTAWTAQQFVKGGNTASRTVITMIATWWISMTSLALVVTSAISVSVVLGKVSAVYVAGPGTTLAILLAGGLCIGRLVRSEGFRARIVARLAPSLNKLDVTADQLEAELMDVASTMKIHSLLPTGGWAILSWVVDASALGLTFAAFGSTLDIGVLMVGYGLANLIGALPSLTPGWLGVLEATLAGTYGALGVDPATAILAVLAYRLASFWLPVFAGLVPAIGALRSGRKESGSRIARRIRALVPAWSR